jgi:hypothetical protein
MLVARNGLWAVGAPSPAKGVARAPVSSDELCGRRFPTKSGRMRIRAVAGIVVYEALNLRSEFIVIE